ncbi:MAG: hypothetical protein LC099_09965 [Anaerolineales bacterium]|nr:hypothetical protein [Anaerolineales bacterium]
MRRKILTLAALIFAALACSAPIDFAPPDADAMRTSVAATVIFDLTQNAPQATATEALQPTQPPAETATLAPTASLEPSQTPSATPTLTLVPVIPTLELLPTESVQISVSVNTNCRTGPGKAYPVAGALMVGKTAQVYGSDPTQRYWYVRNPDPGAEYCWVWTEYATLTGPYLSLPIFTPPPTPTATNTPTPTATPKPQAKFSAEYVGKDSCSGWWLEVRVKNTGTLPLRSMEFRVIDTTNDQKKTALSDSFVNKDGCSSETSKDKILPGDEFTISSPILSYNPNGHHIIIRLTLCSQNGQKGDCLQQKIEFDL